MFLISKFLTKINWWHDVVFVLFPSQNTVDKLVQRANASLLIGTSSWKEQFIDALQVSAGTCPQFHMHSMPHSILRWFLLIFNDEFVKFCKKLQQTLCPDERWWKRKRKRRKRHNVYAHCVSILACEQSIDIQKRKLCILYCMHVFFLCLSFSNYRRW